MNLIVFLTGAIHLQMSEQRIKYLTSLFLNGKCTDEELAELAALIESTPSDSELSLVLEEVWEGYAPDDETKLIAEPYLKQVQKKLPGSGKIRRIFFRRMAVAAAVAAVLVSGAIWFLKDEKSEEKNAVALKVDVEPGMEGAVLTLADGSSIVLDTVKNGVIALQHGIQAVVKNGQLSYIAPDNGMPNETVYNTIKTPRGRQFSLILPDGTLMWLNAASSVRYPLAFHSTERMVSVTGEVFFEVKKDVSRPFRVAAPNQAVVEVLGTSFNLNSYPDEDGMRTTLVEGSVRVTTGNSPGIVLKPGHQAVAKNGSITVHQADVEQVTAWKNGFFHFRDAGIDEVMRQIARWYDLEIEYSGTLPDEKFDGEISRNNNLSEIIRILKLSKIKIRLEDKKLIVDP